MTAKKTKKKRKHLTPSAKAEALAQWNQARDVAARKRVAKRWGVGYGTIQSWARAGLKPATNGVVNGVPDSKIAAIEAVIDAIYEEDIGVEAVKSIIRGILS